MAKHYLTTLNRQHGATLVVSLFILLIMTLIGVASMQNTTLQEKMSGNMRNNNIAFQAAESSLREAETWLAKQVNEPSVYSSCPNNTQCDVLELDASRDLANKDNTWWQGNGRAYSGTIQEASADPTHIIEYATFIDDSLARGLRVPTGKNVYRATASGTGGTGNEQAIVQSSITKRFR